MSIRNPGTGLGALLCAFSLSSVAWGQGASAAPEVAPVPATATAAPAPAAAPVPAKAAAPAPQQVAVPPGYMLVPIPQSSAETRYDVQYPQARGALPPGMELPYEEGDAVPEGYRVRTQPRKGLVIAGSSVECRGRSA